MTLHHAKKVVIITEKVIAKGVCDIIEEIGATGYTITAVGGKGSRNIRSTSDRASVVEDFANIKIEAIMNDQNTAQLIMDKVAEKFFQNYSGITYIESIEILRPQKFGKDDEV